MTAVPFINNIDLNKNEIWNVIIQNLAVPPADPREGQIYYNTVEKRGKIFENGEWRNWTTSESKDYQPLIDKSLQEAKEYTDNKIQEYKPAEINFNEKIAEVLRAQDPTINGLIKVISALNEEEKRQITAPLKEELLKTIQDLIDNLIDGSSEDLNTLKELADEIKKFGDIPKAIEKLPKKEIFTLGNESNGIYTVSHNRNTTDLIVFVYNTARQQVLTDVQVVDNNTVNIIVSAGTDLTGYQVVILG